jgi:putative sterol carrier protein
VARFLSPDWFADVDAADMKVDVGLSLTLEQHVTGAPEGDLRYQVRLGGGRVRITPEGETDADIVLTLDYATAAALARGSMSAHEAFRAGRVRVRGDVARLQAVGPALIALTEALAASRAPTTY